jgi:hypothetical protein
VSSNAFSGKSWPPLEVPCFDGFDQGGGNRIVQARVIEMYELVRGGAFIQAVGIRGGCCSELDGWRILQRNGHLVVGPPPVVHYLHPPQSVLRVTPPSEDDCPIKSDFTPSAMKENLASSIH